MNNIYTTHVYNKTIVFYTRTTLFSTNTYLCSVYNIDKNIICLNYMAKNYTSSLKVVNKNMLTSYQ